MGSGAIYAETRERVGELVSSLSPGELEAKLPATPLWGPRDVVGHLAGVAADVVRGNLEGLGTEAWTAAQVEARREMALEEVLAEWGGTSKLLEPVLDHAPPIVLRVISDCYAHEQDIRGGTGRPGARQADALYLSVDLGVYSLGQRLDEAGLPGLRLRSEEREWRAGGGEAGAVVTAGSAFELLRCLLGRRSRNQVAALTWDGAPASRFLDYFSRFPNAEEDIVE
ncbi:MAG TPA: hypothetical protein VGL92_14815 [Acidimicrobiia bacterium]|jgi:uncharacterized protein (TIGR03083 family)